MSENNTTAVAEIWKEHAYLVNRNSETTVENTREKLTVKNVMKKDILFRRQTIEGESDTETQECAGARKSAVAVVPRCT